MFDNPKPNEIYICRVYDAPVAVVWDAWTDTEKVAQWWGPRGFTLTTHSKELRPGGFWNYTMHGPDGTDYPNRTVYHEVTPRRKLVYDHGATADRAPLFRVTVLFSEKDGKTTMEMTMALATAEQAAATRKFVKEAGGNATWDRLAEFLEKQNSSRDLFVINRSFEASKEVVFSMWTDPEHFVKWLPPAGFEMEILEGEIVPGSSIFFRTSNNKDVTMFAKMSYQAIQSPDFLVYEQAFCNEHGEPGHHPSLPIWPSTMLTTIRFFDEGPHGSRVNVNWEPCGKFTAAEVKAFLNLRSSMTQGWSGSFDKLEAILPVG